MVKGREMELRQHDVGITIRFEAFNSCRHYFQVQYVEMLHGTVMGPFHRVAKSVATTTPPAVEYSRCHLRDFQCKTGQILYLGN